MFVCFISTSVYSPTKRVESSTLGFERSIDTHIGLSNVLGVVDSYRQNPRPVSSQSLQ